MVWIILAGAIAALDLCIKKWIRENKDEGSAHPMLGGRIIVTKYFNSGAMLGFMKEQARLLAGVTIFALGMIVGLILAISGRKGNFLMKLGLTLLLGGAASNAAERLTCGKVTDYFRISIGCKRLEKIIFNIGDFCIFAGSLMALIGSLWRK